MRKPDASGRSIQRNACQVNSWYNCIVLDRSERKSDVEADGH